MTKKLLFLLLVIPIFVSSQILDPVKWSTDTKDLGNNEYEISLKAKIDPGWHIYSQDHPDDGIGIPMELEFEDNDNVQLVGKAREIGKLQDKYSELFQQQEKIYENEVTFVQKIKLKNAKETVIKFSGESQVCDAEKCLPPDFRDYSVTLKPKKEEKTVAAAEPEEPSDKEEIENTEEELEIAAIEESEEDSDAIEEDEETAATPLAINESDNSDKGSGTISADNETKDKSSSRSLWEIFILGVSGGLLALVMPCVFPMIPLTVSLFTKQSQNRSKGITQALIYGLSIIGIFVILAVLATLLFGASALNEFATNPWVNLVFFAVFVFFAISFFGAFEIALPSSLANFSDKQADKGGYLGIFFMAFTLVIISFSCTLPIIGSLAAQAAMTGEYFALIIGSLGFSVTLAIPFVLFAIFPSWMSNLPKSGGWMNTVKVSLGFLELAFAFKFLSNADLVWQAGLLRREVFLAIWIAIFGLMALYLLGRFRMTLDAPTESIGIGRLLFSTLIFAFVIYMIPGMWGAPVKILSGLTPPIHYAESPAGLGGSPVMLTSGQDSGGNNGLIEGQHYGPHQIPAFLDLDHALTYAKKVNKPVMIDFTGHACANCRRVEENVWSDPRVKEKLMNEVVLVSLYVDERTNLPEDQQIYSEVLGRKLKTVGNKWTAFQIEHYQNNAQPYYIVVDENMKSQNNNIGAIYNIDEYLDWMNRGIESYKNNQNSDNHLSTSM